VVEAHEIDADLMIFAAFDQTSSEYSIVDVTPGKVKTFALRLERYEPNLVGLEHQRVCAVRV
jgi:hypothetical protein